MILTYHKSCKGQVRNFVLRMESYNMVRIGSFVINCIFGVAQAFTLLFCLVGRVGPSGGEPLCLQQVINLTKQIFGLRSEMNIFLKTGTRRKHKLAEDICKRLGNYWHDFFAATATFNRNKAEKLRLISFCTN